jgi:hypothetical protein
VPCGVQDREGELKGVVAVRHYVVDAGIHGRVILM